MANDLLASFNAASRIHDHVVFNEKTQEFERAGKRHAIATFFGSAEARAKNNLTLQKIKEALNVEVSESGRFGGHGNVANRMFDNVDGGKRISSSAINAIIREFRREVAAIPGTLRGLKESAAKTILNDRVFLSFGVMGQHAGIARADAKTMVLSDILNDHNGGRAVMEMMTQQLIDSELSGWSVVEAMDELKQIPEHLGNTESLGAVKTRLINFFRAINGDQSARRSFEDVLNLVKGKGSDRFSQMAGCELARIVAAFNANPEFDVQEAMGRLVVNLSELSSGRDALLEMEAMPIHVDSYELALDFGGWKADQRADCMNLLARQPVDSRIPLLAAMKAFGGSRDMLLLHRLVGVQDSIKTLHAYGNLTPESIYCAIEGEMVQIPDCIANETMTIHGEECLAGYYERNAIAEIDEALARTDWSAEKRTAARTESLRLIRTYGVSANDVVDCIDEIDSKYPIFTGKRYWNVVGLRVALGDCFDTMSSGVKYNLLTVPDGYRKPLIEALKLTTGGNSYDDRLLHILVAHRDEIMNLWDAGRLTKANALQIIADGRISMQESVAQINPYYQAICPEFGCGLDDAVGHLADCLKNENEFMIVLDSPRFDRVTFCSREVRDSPERIAEADRHSKDIAGILEMFCGEKNQEQVAMALASITSSAKQMLLPHFILNGAENRSFVFNPLYTINVGESGDLMLNISNLPSSGVAVDWSITIHPDGTHTATDPIVRAANP